MTWLLLFFFMILLASLWVFVRRSLSGEDLTAYDHEVEPLFSEEAASSAHFDLEKSFIETDPSLAKLPKKQLLEIMRKKMDAGGLRVNSPSAIKPVDLAPAPGEWVLAPGADPSKRLLYIHGGAFVMGSPQSHRIITSKFSEISGAAVFAVDYRKRPEHARLDCLEDCQAAYRWMTENGPDGPSSARELYIAGDSSGGNLCLVLLAWIRDNRLPAPTAAVALSPATDCTLSSPSIRKNLATDTMLQAIFKPIIRVPRTLLLILSWLDNKAKPSAPAISPIHGDLAGLPPLLIQASDSECLADDARRYTNKARAAGSDVKLQLWAHMMHAWHAFEPELDEAKDAFEQIRLFLAETRKKTMPE